MTRVALLMALSVGLLCATDKPKPTDKQMKEMMKEKMIAVHRGDTSPYAKAEKEATAAKPNWDELAKYLKPLKTMSADALAHGGYTSNPYRAAVSGLEKAVADKDAKRAAASFAALRKSCAACHHYGGATAQPEATLRKERPKK